MYVCLSQTYTYTNMHTLSCFFIKSRCERVCMVQSPSACEVFAQRYTLKFALDKSENDLKAALSMYVCLKTFGLSWKMKPTGSSTNSRTSSRIVLQEALEHVCMFERPLPVMVNENETDIHACSRTNCFR